MQNNCPGPIGPIANIAKEKAGRLRGRVAPVLALVALIGCDQFHAVGSPRDHGFYPYPVYIERGGNAAGGN